MLANELIKELQMFPSHTEIILVIGDDEGTYDLFDVKSNLDLKDGLGISDEVIVLEGW